MIVVTLPDGSSKKFNSPTTILEVAHSIGSGLAKATLAGKISDKIVDASYVIDHDVNLEIITAKTDEGLEILRHSCAHLMAQAVQSLYPGTQVTIGPTIENGFYYDFATKSPLSSDNLVEIEAQMKRIAKSTLEVSRHIKTRQEAIELFKALGEDYKVQIIKNLPEDEQLTLYQQGDFIDLCRGPHVPNTRHLKHFKLMRVAGAYWRGDSNNEMLQRIYGTCWSDKKELSDYLYRLEEMQKRDHRKIGKQLNLFHQQDEAPGMIFWHEKGWSIYQTIVSYIRDNLKNQSYQEVSTPQVVDSSLWVKSGHAEKYKENMFLTESENKEFAIKPMNCPCHVQIFKQGLTSYRDLPIRYAEFGCCHRNEPSGGLHGLMRVRSMVQDDGHIFCTEDQILSEVKKFTQEVFSTYQDFGFDQQAIQVKIALRPEKRIGDDATWDKAEAALISALKAQEIAFELLPGEGAFYGPKVEFHLRDCLNRLWQCGTIQLDYMMAERLGATFINENSKKETPIVLHRAILGSIERFMGILIEHYAGKMPIWLTPIQVAIMGISNDQDTYAKKITQKLKNFNIKTTLDLRNEKIGFKIREHTLARIPYCIVLGSKEEEQKLISVRRQNGEDLGKMKLDQFIDMICADINSKS